MQPTLVDVNLPSGIDAVAASISHTSDKLTVYLRGGLHPASRYSLLVTDPMATLQSRAGACSSWPFKPAAARDVWKAADDLLKLYHTPDSFPSLPAGGCFGYWGYHLKDLLEPALAPRVHNNGPFPDCLLGFFPSVLAHDHASGKTWIISTGLNPDGSRSEAKAREQVQGWRSRIDSSTHQIAAHSGQASFQLASPVRVGLEREDFIRLVRRAQEYIRSGDIYQVNLSHALHTAAVDTWELFQELCRRSPAPYSAWLSAADLKVGSSSPEQFLQMHGRQIQTRPIKGTRPRASDTLRDEHLGTELMGSAKENAELLMITDLLRNDLGKVCEYGSCVVPELARLEKYSHVQHLVSTITGRLSKGVTHLQALKACFPGGSITGAPKFRAMQIIDELETAPRGAYTGALGYIGFNELSHLSILIRTAFSLGNQTWFNVGAGIVADSVPEAEYDETLIKAEGFMAALRALSAKQENAQ